MPTNKDFKRVVRARMQKTGESYTAARATLLAQTPSRIPAPPGPVADYARLAGMSDAAVKQKTGCTWEKWVWALDRVEAYSWPHSRIATYIREKYQPPSWWTQTVTVGYERIKGLRAIGQRRDGGYMANKSKTFSVPVPPLYRAVSDRRFRVRWLPEGVSRFSSSRREKYLRGRGADGTPLEFVFSARGRGRSTIQVQQGPLPDAAAASRVRRFWGERLAALGQLLADATAERDPGKGTTGRRRRAP